MKNHALTRPLVYTIIFLISMMAFTVLLVSRNLILIILLYPFYSSPWIDTILSTASNQATKTSTTFIIAFAFIAVLIMMSIMGWPQP